MIRSQSLKLARRILYRFQPILFPIITWYYSKERIIRKSGLQLRLRPSVFHPSLYHSTDVLLQFIESYDLKDKSLLELGAGSGFISLYLAKNRQLTMTASDINPEAVAGIRQNARSNDITLEVLQSDLFVDIPQQVFDFILINPPYYSQDPKNESEFAFFAGADLNYFTRLFSQVSDYIDSRSQVFMVLSENVPLDEIKRIGSSQEFHLEAIHQEKVWGEDFIIYRVV